MNDQEKIEFLEKAIEKLFPKLGCKKITTDDILLDLGLDSLDVVELQLYYEEIFNKEIPDAKAPIVTVKDLLTLMI